MTVSVRFWRVDQEYFECHTDVLSVDIDNISVSIRDVDSIVTYRRQDILSFRVEADS